jgi:diadenosine tetraphosphatase ApaH/serine/threonine PP2A family protein phosphatase
MTGPAMLERIRAAASTQPFDCLTLMRTLSTLVLFAGFVLCANTGFSQQWASSIRNIDFANFRYVGSIGHFRAEWYPRNSFTLRNGKFGDWRDGMTLRKIVYGDVTGDATEEAIVTFDVNTDGNAGIDQVYIYTLKNHRPTFLWGFEGGDRAEGGLRQAYADHGELVIELYGRGTRIGGYIGNTEPVGLCCPESFTRTRYRFRKGHFVKHGKMEILPNPAAKTNCPTCLPGS